MLKIPRPSSDYENARTVISQQQPSHSLSRLHGELQSINGAQNVLHWVEMVRLLRSFLTWSLDECRREGGAFGQVCFLQWTQTLTGLTTRPASPPLGSGLSGASPGPPQQRTGTVFSHQCFLAGAWRFIILITLIDECPTSEYWVVRNFLLFEITLP